MKSQNTCLVNGLSLFKPLSGVGRSTFELCKRIFYPDGIWTPLYYYGHYSNSLLDSEAPEQANIGLKDKILESAISIVRKSYLLKRAARMAVNAFAALRRRKVNKALLYWEPNHVILEALEAKYKLLTIYDLSCLLYPQWHPQERLDFFDAHFLRGVNSADMIVTGSDTIRHEVIERLEVPEDRVLSIHCGVDHELFRPLQKDSLEVFRERENLPDRFVLCVGSLEPRKNLSALLDAWLELPNRIINKHKLILISNSGWENECIMEKIRKGEGSVYLRTDVPSCDLPYYYNLSELTVYVSLYEGFGLPTVEAMACGSPVLASNIPTLKEVLGDAAMYIEPNTKSIAEYLEAFLTAPPDRAITAEKCLKRASLYNWENAAQKYLSIMKGLGSSKG